MKKLIIYILCAFAFSAYAQPREVVVKKAPPHSPQQQVVVVQKAPPHSHQQVIVVEKTPPPPKPEPRREPALGGLIRLIDDIVDDDHHHKGGDKGRDHRR